MHCYLQTLCAKSPDRSRDVPAFPTTSTAQIWNTVTGKCEEKLNHGDLVNSAVFFPDGMHIVSASVKTAWIWNTATGDCEAKLKGHTSLIISVVFSPDGVHIVSASCDYTAWT